MISIREMVGVFFGRKPMEEFASHRYPIIDGAVNYSISFALTSFLLVFEFLALWLILGVMDGQGTMGVITNAAIYGVGLAILVPVLLVGSIICAYLWGAVHFFLAKFYAGMPGSLNDFNGSWLSLMGSITLVQRLLAMLALLAWFMGGLLNLGGAISALLLVLGLVPCGIIQLYGMFLTYKFIKARLNISNARAAIVVLLPIAVLLALLLVPAFAIMAAVGAKLI